jgi:pimeloyl-ACP methyl ester carboxylesterase
MLMTVFREAGDRAAGAHREFSRRAALAREPKPIGMAAPSLRLFLDEIRSIADRRGGERDARRIVGHHHALHPQPVMLLPGFGAHPGRMRRMGRTLAAAGHRVEDWGLGHNLGPTEENFAFLMARVEALAQYHGGPVALVGWSLGGMFARELARRQPHNVRKVITLGTPFSGDRRANNVWRAYHFVTGMSVDAPPIADCDFTTKPAVPTIAIWSARDGVVAPRTACGRPHERDRAVALRCNHMGFPRDPRAILEVLRQLDWED